MAVFMPPCKELRLLYDSLTVMYMRRRKEALDRLKSRAFPTNADEAAAFEWVGGWIDDKCPAMPPSSSEAFTQRSASYRHCLLAVATEVSEENENSPTETILLLWGSLGMETAPQCVTADMLLTYAIDFLRITTYPAPRLAAEVAVKTAARERAAQHRAALLQAFPAFFGRRVDLEERASMRTIGRPGQDVNLVPSAVAPGPSVPAPGPQSPGRGV